MKYQKTVMSDPYWMYHQTQRRFGIRDTASPIAASPLLHHRSTKEFDDQAIAQRMAVPQVATAPPATGNPQTRTCINTLLNGCFYDQAQIDKSNESILSHHFINVFRRLSASINRQNESGRLEIIRVAVQLTLKECHNLHGLGGVADLIVKVTRRIEVAFHGHTDGPIIMSKAEMNIFREELAFRRTELSKPPFDFESHQDIYVPSSHETNTRSKNPYGSMVLKYPNTAGAFPQFGNQYPLTPPDSSSSTIDPAIQIQMRPVSPKTSAPTSSLAAPDNQRLAYELLNYLRKPSTLTEASLKSLSNLREPNYNLPLSPDMYYTLISLATQDEKPGYAPWTAQSCAPAMVHPIPFRCRIAARNNLEELVSSKAIRFGDA